MSLYRFVNREGWERWIEIRGNPPYSYVVADRPRPRFQGVFIDGQLGSVSYPAEARRVFFAERYRHIDGTEETVYTEDHERVETEHFGDKWPSAHRERTISKALRRIASIVTPLPELPIGALLGAHSQVSQIADVLNAVPDHVLRRDRTQCHIHDECRRDPGMGRACKASLHRETGSEGT